MDYFKFRQNLKNPADAFALTSWSTHAPIRKTKHFDYFKTYSLSNKINAEFWLAKNSNHVDAMLKYPSEYSEKMEKFYNSILK